MPAIISTAHAAWPDIHGINDGVREAIGDYAVSLFLRISWNFAAQARRRIGIVHHLAGSSANIACCADIGEGLNARVGKEKSK